MIIHQNLTYQIGSEDWWRLRRLQLSGVGDFLRNWNKDLIIKLNILKDELDSVFKLVHDRYLFAKIIEPQPDKRWFTKFHLLPTTKVFTAYRKEDKKYTYPICTTTVVFDSPDFGLPSDNIYHDKLEELRNKGKKIAEFCSLAALPNMQSRNAYFPIFKILYKYVKEQGFTDLVITIQPKHVGFYEKVLLFKCFEPRSYPRFRNVKARMAHLDLLKAEERYKTIYKNFPHDFNLFKFFTSDLEQKFDFEEINQKIIPEQDFRELFINTNIWKSLNKQEKEKILQERESFLKKQKRKKGRIERPSQYIKDILSLLFEKSFSSHYTYHKQASTQK